jgi:hypothetical protein
MSVIEANAHFLAGYGFTPAYSLNTGVNYVSAYGFVSRTTVQSSIL